MRLTLLAALAILMLPSAAYSQSSRDRPSEGDYGLTFMLSGFQSFSAKNLQAVPIPGDTAGLFSGIGVKYFISSRLAARFGLGFSQSVTTVKPLPNAPAGSVNEVGTMTMFSLSPGLEFTLIDAGDVRGYSGFQLGLISGTYSIEGDNHDPDNSGKNTRWLYSAGGFLGAEWFFADRLSVGAEYHLQYIIRSGTNRSTYNGNTNEYDLDTESWLNLESASSFNLLINIYL